MNSSNATLFGPPPTFHQCLAMTLISIKIFLNSIGLFLNCLLFHMIIKNYRKLHKTLSILLAYILINDCFMSLALLLTMTRRIQCHDSLINVFFGPCTLVSTSFCHFLDAVYLHAIQNWILSHSLLICFFALLSSAQSFLSVKKTIAFCGLAWFPGLVSLVLRSTYKFSRPKVLKSISRCYDENFSYSQIDGYESFYNSPGPITVFMLIVPNIPHYFLVYWFRRKQNCDLQQKIMSKSTLQMHNTLRKISTMKAFLPLFLLVDALIFFLCQLEILPPQFVQHFLGTTSSSISILNPVIAICCFRPYRETFKDYCRLVKWNHRKITLSERSSEEIVNL